MIKNLLAIWETQVWSLDQEDLEKELAAHSRIPAWRILWAEEPGGLQQHTHTHTHITVTHYTLIQNVHLHLCTEPYRQTHKIWRVDPWLLFTTVAQDPLILISPWIQLTLHSPLTVNSPHYSLALKQTRTRTTWKSETENRRQTVTSGLYTLFHIWLTWFLSTYKGKEHCTVCVYLIYLQIIPHLVSSAQLLPIWEKCCLPIPSLSIPSLQTPQILG